MQQLTKSLKRKLGEQSMRAHEEELRRALLPLADSFDQWRAGKLDSGSLALLVRNWDRGPQTDLFKKYNYGIIELNVAQAIVTGILDEKQIDPQLLEHLQPHIAFCRHRLRESAESNPLPSTSSPNGRD